MTMRRKYGGPEEVLPIVEETTSKLQEAVLEALQPFFKVSQTIARDERLAQIVKQAEDEVLQKAIAELVSSDS